MRRRNPKYESFIDESGIEICADGDRDCKKGDTSSELYIAAVSYRKAFNKAKKAITGGKSFPVAPKAVFPIFDGLGREYRVRYKVIQTDEDGKGPLMASNMPGSFFVNRDYPPKLQARDLSVPAEKMKIEKIAQFLDPVRLLLPHSDATLGAPVVWEGKKGEYYALAGNGRLISLLMAKDARYDLYEAAGAELWPSLWPKKESPKGKRAVLVRIITNKDGSKLTQKEAIQFAGASQVSTSGAETPIREALSFVRALGLNPDEIPAPQWYGEVTGDNVQRFAKENNAFIRVLLDQLDKSQRARVSVDNWVLSKTVSMALSGFLPPEIVNEGFGSVKEEEALLAILPALVYLNDLVKKGQVKKNWNLLPHLVGAKTFLGKVKSKSYAKTIDWITDTLPNIKAQRGMFGGGEDKLKGLTPMGIGLGLYLKKAIGAADPASRAVALKKYIEEAVEEGRPKLGFGAMASIDPLTVLADELLGKQLGGQFMRAIQSTFGRSNPKRRRRRRNRDTISVATMDMKGKKKAPRRKSKKGIVYFLSGTHAPGEIRGFSEAGSHIGTTVPNCTASCVREYKKLKGTDTKVFVDSGAFSEVARSGPPVVVKPMTDSDWKKVFALYKKLAPLGDNLYVVAPDQIGNQDVSLERLSRYLGDLVDLAERGVNIIVPVQKGRSKDDTLEEYDATAFGIIDDYLSFTQPMNYRVKELKKKFIHGIPSNKGAPTTSELKSYFQAIKPKRVHFLGMGPSQKGKWKQFKPVVERYIPNADISMDSVRITALVGRERSLGAYTATQDEAAAELLEEMRTGPERSPRGRSFPTYDWSEVSAQPMSFTDWSWMTPQMVKKTASDILRDRRMFSEDHFDEKPQTLKLLKKVAKTGNAADFEKWLNEVNEFDYSYGSVGIIESALRPHYELFISELNKIRRRGSEPIRKEWKEYRKDVVSERKRRAARRLTPSQLLQKPSPIRRRKFYDVMTPEGQIVEVEAVKVKGVWGIHKENRGYVIAHIPSGTIIFNRTPVKANALRAIKALSSDLPNWAAKVKFGKTIPKKDRDAFSRYLASLEGNK